MRKLVEEQQKNQKTIFIFISQFNKRKFIKLRKINFIYIFHSKDKYSSIHSISIKSFKRYSFGKLRLFVDPAAGRHSVLSPPIMQHVGFVKNFDKCFQFNIWLARSISQPERMWSNNTFLILKDHIFHTRILRMRYQRKILWTWAKIVSKRIFLVWPSEV